MYAPPPAVFRSQYHDPMMNSFASFPVNVNWSRQVTIGHNDILDVHESDPLPFETTAPAFSVGTAAAAAAAVAAVGSSTSASMASSPRPVSPVNHALYDPVHPNATFNSLNESQIAHMPLSQLEEICLASGFTLEQVKEVKATRRRMKNRMSARECSTRRREQNGTLEAEHERLQAHMRALALENTTLRQQLTAGAKAHEQERAALGERIRQLLAVQQQQQLQLQRQAQQLQLQQEGLPLADYGALAAAGSAGSAFDFLNSNDWLTCSA